MFEVLNPVLLYNLGKDALRFLFRRRGRRLTEEQKIELRQKWNPMFRDEILKTWRDELRRDVIIRDVRRVDSYPDLDENSRGISPWFRVGLIDLYHRGIVVAFGWQRLVQDSNGTWRERDNSNNNEADKQVVLAGRIPFENIEAVDWRGDEYYHYPHIYCHFSINKEPYESVDYYTELSNPHTRPHYVVFVNALLVKRRHQNRWQRLRVCLRNQFPRKGG